MKLVHTFRSLSLRSVLILSSYLRLGVGLFLSGSSANILYPFFIPPCVLHAPPISPDFVVLIIFDDEYDLQSVSLCKFLHPCVNFFLLGQNILVGTLFCNTVSLCFPLKVSQVSHSNNRSVYSPQRPYSFIWICKVCTSGYGMFESGDYGFPVL
jgi:hypothetical protein